MPRINPYEIKTRTIFAISFASAVLAALIVLILMIQNEQNATLVNRQNGLVNQTYARIQVCILSVTPATRTNDYIKNCYVQAEQVTHQNVLRYGDAK